MPPIQPTQYFRFSYCANANPKTPHEQLHILLLIEQQGLAYVIFDRLIAVAAYEKAQFDPKTVIGYLKRLNGFVRFSSWDDLGEIKPTCEPERIIRYHDVLLAMGNLAQFN